MSAITSIKEFIIEDLIAKLILRIVVAGNPFLSNFKSQKEMVVGPNQHI